MADENNTPPTNNDGAQPPASGAVATQTPNADSQTKTAEVELAKKLGELEAENKALKEYQAKVDPVIETLWSDQELLKKTTELHNKRLGISTEPVTTDKTETPAAPSKIEVDNRNFAITQVVGQFNQAHGFDKMTPEQQKEFNQRVGMALQEHLDPMGNKNLQQIMEDVSVTKLPKFLENAYNSAFKDDIIARAKEEGKIEAQNSSLGVIGSMPSTSIETNNITLTAKERDICQKAGWDEAKYLENKKELAKKGNSIF